MITLLTGENSFEIDNRLKQIVAEFEGEPERFDGADLELRQLPDILMAQGLFSDKRLVIVRDLSENKQLWEVLPDWVDRIDSDIHLVFIESKPDKRTKSYKMLQKIAAVEEFNDWSERDTTRAEKWVVEQAKARNMTLTTPLAGLIVGRVGVNQWSLMSALDKLELLGELSDEIIRDVIDARPSENAFDLLETALRGDHARVQGMVEGLALSEDPYQLFGLLSGQAFQLAALSVARSDDNVARDIGAHPFALSRLKPYSKKRGLARRVVEKFATADEAMKTSSSDPWVLIERALLGISE